MLTYICRFVCHNMLLLSYLWFSTWRTGEREEQRDCSLALSDHRAGWRHQKKPQTAGTQQEHTREVEFLHCVKDLCMEIFIIINSPYTVILALIFALHSAP